MQILNFHFVDTPRESVQQHSVVGAVVVVAFFSCSIEEGKSNCFCGSNAWHTMRQTEKEEE